MKQVESQLQTFLIPSTDEAHLLASRFSLGKKSSQYCLRGHVNHKMDLSSLKEKIFLTRTR